MQIVKISPDIAGKKTQMTIEMSADEARRFSQALEEGKLAHLGIAGASFASHQAEIAGAGWRETERSKRATSTNTPRPKRP